MINVEKFDLPFNEDIFRKLLLDIADKNFSKRIKQTRRYLWYMVFLLLVHISTTFVLHTPNRKMDYYIYPIFYVAAFGYYVHAFIQTRKNKKKNLQATEDWINLCKQVESYALAFNEENLTIWADEEKTIYKWTDFKSIFLDEHYLSLSGDEASNFLFFPREAFVQKDIYDKLITLAKKYTSDDEKSEQILESLIGE